MRSKKDANTPVILLMMFLALNSGKLGNAQASHAGVQPTSSRRVQLAAGALAAAYDPTTGLFLGTGWWNSANGITALADASRALSTTDYDPLFTNTFNTAPHQAPGFLNEFYDDEGWWAIAWIDVYSLRGGKPYLAMAKSIFADMTGGWSDTCGGGIWWKKNEHYKNAIANELFLSVAVHLALLSRGEERAGYLHWAQQEARWFLASGMINADSLVNDGLDASCHNNGKTTWTYNQGVLIGGLVGLSQLTGDQQPLQQAQRIATAATQHLVDTNGVVHESCEPDCGADGVQFKGILMRNLVPLALTSPSPAIRSLINTNAASVWSNARTPENHFSTNWSGPPSDGGTGSLISALDALVASLSLADSNHSAIVHEPPHVFAP